MRELLFKKLCSFADDKRMMFLTADMGAGAVEELAGKLGDRFLNVGIAEQNMALVASGLALDGRRVFFFSICTFPSLRCLEMIRNDICYPNLDVTILNFGTGMEYGALGVTHHFTEDVAMLRALPNMKVYTPSCEDEITLIMDELYKDGGPAYIRLQKSGAVSGAKDGKASSDSNGQGLSKKRDMVNTDSNKNTMRLGYTNTTINLAEKGNGKGDTAIIASGPIIGEAMGLDTDVYSLVNFFKNKEMIVNVMKNYKKIISVEEHQIVGGLYSYLCELKNEANLNVQITPVALTEFTPTVGTQKELRTHYKIDKGTIREKLSK